MICSFITKYRASFGVVPICRVLTEHGCKIAPRTYYAHLGRTPSKRSLWDTTITLVLAGLYEPDSDGRRQPESLYGATKMWAHLRRQGIPVARCTVGRLTGHNGWQGVRRQKRIRTTNWDPGASFQNSAQVFSIGIFFSLMIAGLSRTLPGTLRQGLVSHGVSLAVADKIASLPPVSVLFSALLGFNPVQKLLGTKVLASLPSVDRTALIGKSFFPKLISLPFQSGLREAFIFAVVACIIAAAVSLFRGGSGNEDVTPVTAPEIAAPEAAIE